MAQDETIRPNEMHVEEFSAARRAERDADKLPGDLDADTNARTVSDYTMGTGREGEDYGEWTPSAASGKPAASD